MSKKENKGERKGESKAHLIEEESAEEALFTEFASHTTADLTSVGSSVWVIDSGATAYVCHDASKFYKLESTTNRSIILGDLKKYKIDQIGALPINTQGTLHQSVKLKNVLLVPQLSVNLFSIPTVDRRCYTSIFKNGKFELRNKNDDIVLRGTRKTKLFVLDEQNDSANLTQTAKETQIELWHCRLGHPSNERMKTLMNTNAIEGIPKMKETKINCESCSLAKNTRNAYSKTAHRKDESFRTHPH